VTRDQIEAFRPAIGDLVFDAIRRLPDWTPEAVFQEALDGNVQIWLLGPDSAAPTAIVLTQLITCPGASFCHILGVAGEDKERYTPFIYDVIAPFAKEKGCDYLQAFAREGWERTSQIRDHGWEKVAIVIRKPLHEVRQAKSH
jgi:hypothetical protein